MKMQLISPVAPRKIIDAMHGVYSSVDSTFNLGSQFMITVQYSQKALLKLLDAKNKRFRRTFLGFDF